MIEAMPMPLVAGQRRDIADHQRRCERRRLAGEGEQPEELRHAIGGREAGDQAAARRLHRSSDDADQHRECQEPAFARRRERRTAGDLGRYVLGEQHVRLVDRQDADGAGDHHQQRQQDDALGADPVVEKAADEGPDRAGQHHQDAEDALLA